MKLRDYQNVVLLCLSPLGDTLFATPAIRALGESLPKARIIILANPPATKILKSNPFGMETITVSDQWSFLKVLSFIRKQEFDLALGLSLLGSLFTHWCGTSCHNDFNDINCPKSQSVVQMCLEIVRTIGLNPNTNETEFWINDLEAMKAVQVVTSLLDDSGCYKAPLVAIHCGGHYFIRKRWPLSYFVQLIQMLQVNFGFRVVLVGGPEDRQNASQIETSIPGVINIAGHLRLTETAVLLQKCQLFIGNDSGPLHLAAALRRPTIGLFGPTSPNQFYPYHSPTHKFLYKGLSCSPCYQFGGSLWQQIPRCSRSYCMEAISPEEVVKEVEYQLGCLRMDAVW